MAQMQSITRIAWNLEMDARISKENVSIWDLNLIHPQSDFYLIICGYL